jgi:hypothetical protein
VSTRFLNGTNPALSSRKSIGLPVGIGGNGYHFDGPVGAT